MPRLLALAVVGVAVSAPAYAQDTVEALVVTARGREERLAEAPASIAVLPLDQREVRRLEEIGTAAPGVFVIDDQDPGTNIVSIRGVSTDRLQAASIAYVVDGVAASSRP